MVLQILIMVLVFECQVSESKDFLCKLKIKTLTKKCQICETV